MGSYTFHRYKSLLVVGARHVGGPGSCASIPGVILPVRLRLGHTITISHLLALISVHGIFDPVEYCSHDTKVQATLILQLSKAHLAYNTSRGF